MALTGSALHALPSEVLAVALDVLDLGMPTLQAAPRKFRHPRHRIRLERAPDVEPIHDGRLTFGWDFD